VHSPRACFAFILSFFLTVQPARAGRSKSFQPQSNSYKAHKTATLHFVQLKNGKPGAYI
jgi:hypothetical protein